MLERLLAALALLPSPVPAAAAASAAVILPAAASAAVALPAAAPLVAAPLDSSPATYIVRPGDTLSRIADRHGVTVAQLRRWNGLTGTSVPRPDGALRLSAPGQARPPWRSRVETVTATEANGDPDRECPVPASSLRRVWVRYADYDGVVHDGNLIVHRSIVAATRRSFALLYAWRFPVMVMQPASVNLPGLTDRTVLTSGYECRTVAGTNRWSQHAYGLAIDVNPRQNPMIRGDYLDPPHSEPWIPRGPYRPGMIHDGGAERAFTTNGLAWGGRWHSLKDYMHFSPNNR
ncbi:M15 family metallopeptidase [Actinoplanes teichomyceticus]|uniref:LysM domain-containing protein n=1 Tax=Actinoplanes teichomyceticus TaxID=1867 RepID=A0A561WJW1_ACTTI|nr:M15 family metallopeptidase [Actinoplanes teichomyceticus]TWG24161.1 LysM domain-containing protein [Actinoplanes teichomyceticus]GIF12995.1 hypothetical protein Ate01nite_30270 [Actinoplanes teichomyceticus]